MASKVTLSIMLYIKEAGWEIKYPPGKQIKIVASRRRGSSEALLTPPNKFDLALNEEYEIGREPKFSHQIAFPAEDERCISISRSHAKLRFDREVAKCVLIDSGSTNGTFVNERMLTPKKDYHLANEDVIRFGTSAPSLVLRYIFTNQKGDTQSTENDILLCIAIGKSDKEIAKFKGFSIANVRHHIKQWHHRLGINDNWVSRNYLKDVAQEQGHITEADIEDFRRRWDDSGT